MVRPFVIPLTETLDKKRYMSYIVTEFTYWTLSSFYQILEL